MAQGVVYGLEVVEVHKHHGHLGAAAPGARDGAGEVLVEVGLVVEAGEVVVGGLVHQACFQLLVLGRPQLQVLVALSKALLGPLATVGHPRAPYPKGVERWEDPTGTFVSGRAYRGTHTGS